MGTNSSIYGKLAEQCGADYVEDGAKLIIECSNCKCKLVEIWRTKPHVKIITRVVATCAICGDKSFAKDVRGGFHMAPVEGSSVKPSDMKQGEPSQEGETVILSATIITSKV